MIKADGSASGPNLQRPAPFQKHRQSGVARSGSAGSDSSPDGAGAPGSPESGRPPRRSCLFCARLPDLPATGKIGSFCSVNRELCHCNARPWGRPAQPPNLGYLRLVAWGLARADQVCSIQVGLEICQVACSIVDGAFVKSPGLARDG
jgi:hypothetical protein